MSEGPPPRHYFQCTAPDRAMYAIGKHQPSSIHVRVDLHGLLDAERLALAWRRLPELHPILGCTLPHPALRPRWRPGRSAPRELVETSETAPSQTEAPGPAELRLLNEALDVRRGPPARLALLRRPDATHRLLLSVHHAAMDARATVNVANAVNELYGALARHPEIELAPDYSLRTMREVFRQQGVRSKQRRRLARGQQGREGRIGKSRHRDPRPQKGIAYRRGTVTYREWILEPDVLAGLSPRRQEAGWTLNDVLLGLLAWSWARALGAGEHKRKMSAWLATADARPWFGVQGGLGNLSGLEPVGLPGVEQADPSGAVAIAHSAMAECKAGRLGLGGHVLGNLLCRLTPPGLFGPNFRAAARLASSLVRYNRCFTNIGALGAELHDWDGARATHATVIAPLPAAPLTIITGSGFQGRVSLVVGFREGWLTDDQLTNMHHALLEGLAQLAEC